MSRPTKIKEEVVYVYADNNPLEVRRGQKVVHDQDAERRIAVRKVASFIWLLFGLLDVLLLFRFALKLIGANPQNAFANFVYDLSDLFLSPFAGLIESPSSDGMVLDLPVLVAVIVYSLVAWVLVRLVWLVLYRPGERIISTYEEST
jgi:YggT family protein